MSAPFEEAPRHAKDLLPPPAPAWPPAKVSRRRLIAVVIVISILIPLSMLLFNALLRPSHTTTVSDGPGQRIPPGWRRYTDPGGSFSGALPNGWTVQRSSDTATMGNTNTGQSVTVEDVTDAFGGPPGGPNTITVSILVEPIVNDFQRQQFICSNRWPQNTTIDGLPAYQDTGMGMWILDTNTAHFQINSVYPNWKGDVLMRPGDPTATPMPPGFYEQGQRQIQTIIASFTPMPATPLTCK